MKNQLLVDILNKNTLYRNIMLLKIYMATNGQVTGVIYNTLEKDLKELFGADFDRNTYFDVKNRFKEHDRYIKGNIPNKLTHRGIDAAESLIKSLSEIDNEEILETPLSDRLKDFISIGANVVTIGQAFIYLNSLIPN